MPKKIRGAFQIGCLFLCLFLNTKASARQPQKQESSIQHEVTVTLKLVQVYVADREGRPVPDLLVTDFDLFDNGKPMPITEFEKHTSAIAGTTDKEKEASSAPGPARLSRKFFLFFDFVFNNPLGFEHAKSAALHFLGAEIRPSDEVGVISYSIYKGLTVHEYLTTDHQKVREVIEGFGQKDILGRAQNLEAEYWNALKDLLGEPHLTVPQTMSAGFLNPAKLKLQELSVDRMNYQLHVRNFTQKMADLAKSLRMIPGYKYIIFFSSGIAGSVFQGAPEVVDRSKAEAAQRAGNAALYNVDSLDVAIALEKKYETMIKELAQANCPVFVFNTEELGQDQSFKKAMSGEYPLKKISEISGGKYFPQVEEYESSLAQVQDITSTYYVLGYYIQAKEDGKFHEIKVKVRKKGYEVHSQGGYFNPKPFPEYTEFEKTIQLLDVALSENPQLQTPAEFPLTALACPTDQGNLVVLLSEISKDVVYSPGKSQNEVVTLILDGQKNVVNFKRAAADFATLAQPALCYYTFTLLPPGDYDCRVVVRNLKSGQTAAARESVHVAPATDAPLALLPPLLLRPEAGMYYLEIQKTEGAEASSSTPSLTSVYPFNAKEFSPWLGQIPAGTTKAYAMVVCALGDLPEADIELSFLLKEDASGQEVPVHHSVLSAKQYLREEDEKRWLALLSQLDFSGLKPGAYLLKVRAKETTTMAEAESSQKLNIR
jgi:VWFA-related protein